MTLRAVERPGHRCTTRHAQAIYPFVNADGLGGRGVFVGRDSTGGAFCFDPWVLYARGGARRPERDRPRQARAGQELAGQDAAVADDAVRSPSVRARRQARVRAAVPGRRRAADLAGAGRQRAPEPARVPTRGARPAGAAASGDGDGARRPAHPAGGGWSARGAARRARSRLRRTDAAGRSPRCCSHRWPRWRSDCRPPRTTLAGDARRAALALQDLCEGPLRGMFDGPTTPGLALDAQAAGAGPACGPRFTGGRDPDGMCDRLDQRVAGADRGATGPGAADQRRRRVVEDRPAHRARRVVSVQLQARAAVRRDEPGRAAQARRPAGGRRRGVAGRTDRRGSGRRRFDPGRLPPG